jgi:hypothetical protein
MIDIKAQLEKSKTKGSDLIAYITKHRTVIIIFVASTAIIAALMQTQSYLNPARNEDKYNENKSSITTKTIDEEKLEKLQAIQQDKIESVDSSFVPDRSNPFVE